MSRYLVEGIVRDVAEGKDVVIVSPFRAYSLDVFGLTVKAAAKGEWWRVVRANGNESATHVGGGTVRPIAATASLRGRRIDVLVVLDFRAMTDKQQDEIRAAASLATEMQLLS